MLVLPIFLPVLLTSMIADAIDDLQRRLPTLVMSASALLAATRAEWSGVEVGVRLHFETTADGRLTCLRLDIAPPPVARDDLSPHIFVDVTEAAAEEALRIQDEVVELYLFHEVRRRMDQQGREILQLNPSELDDVIASTEEARTDRWRRTDRLDEWTLHEVAVREQVMRSVTSNHDGPAAYQKAKPLRDLLEIEAKQSRSWWENLSKDARSTWSRHVPESTPEAERMVLAYRSHLRYTESVAVNYAAEANALRAIYSLPPAA